MIALVTGAVPSATDFCRELSDLGIKVIFHQMETDPLPEGALSAEVVVCNGLFLHRDYRIFPNLRFVQLTSAGYDRVPVREMEKSGIVVRNAGNTFAIPMAEHVLCCTLMLLRHMPAFFRNQDKKKWVKDRSLSELSGKTVCILGCGSVGTECAKRFGAFGVNVIGIARHEEEKPCFSEVVCFTGLDRVLPKADIFVLATSLNESTRGLVDRRVLSLMKEGSLLINVSRGEIVNEDDLTNALETGHLAGAALDVFEKEPLSTDSSFWGMGNVVVTPHNSFVGEADARRFFMVALDNISRHVEKEGRLR